MKTIVISYSQTGNNNKLACAIAKNLTANHIKIAEPKPRTFLAIGLDTLLNRTPKINSFDVNFEDFDMVIFVSPVWMGQVASPLRAVFRLAKSKVKQYAFVSLSGGADGPNTKLENELKSRIGVKPQKVINFLIAELLPQNPKPTRQQTEDYRLDDEVAIELSEKIVYSLKKLE
jgi:flavodoxin